MAGISDYLAQKLLNAAYGASSFTFPSQTYLALFTVNPTPAGGGTEASSSGTGYARQLLTGSWGAAGGSTGAITIANSAAVTFGGTSGFTGAIGTVVGWATYDAATGGNMLHYGLISAGNQKTYAAGDIAIIPVGALTIQDS